MNVEKEIKILLSEEHYNTIDNQFDWKEEYEQVNYYYETVGEVVDLERTIRIRCKNGKKKLQIKIPEYRDKSLHVKNEYEEVVSDIPRVLDKEVLNNLAGEVFSSDATLVGTLTTLRKINTQFDNVEICLDRNEYLGMIDYELEIEFTGPYPDEILNIIKKYITVTDAEARGKHSRFLQRKMNSINEME